MLRLYLYARVRISLHLLHTGPRVQQAPGIPCALLFGRMNLQSPGETRRGKVKVCLRPGMTAHTHPVNPLLTIHPARIAG